MGNLLSKNRYTRLEAVAIDETAFECYTEVSSAARNAEVESVTDEAFGKASNLLEPKNPKANSIELSNQEETDRDGWIVKRHETQARVTIKLCNTSRIFGFDIDTTGFISTCPTHAIIEGYSKPSEETEGMWTTLVQEEVVREDSHNFFQIVNDDTSYSHVRLTVAPGGGIARFRTYGEIIPDWSDKTNEYNLASANHGARIVRWSDTENANKPNILLDNGTLTAHGWLTPRSRDHDRNDFIIIQLAAAGTLNSIVVDSTGFAGNTPLKIRVEGCNTQEDDPYQDVYTQWIPLVTLSEIKEDDLNTFAVISEDILTHVRLTVYPDGGLQQIKCFGFLDQNKQLEYNEAKMLTSQSFSTEDTFVADDEVVEKEDVEMDNAAIEEINLCKNSPLSPPSTSNKKKQKTMPIEDADLYEKTIIEELNGSTTQLLTPVVEKSHPQDKPITAREKEALNESELAAIEQLNATKTQVAPPPTYIELDRDNISPITIVSVDEIVLNEVTTEEMSYTTVTEEVVNTHSTQRGKRKSREPASDIEEFATAKSKPVKKLKSLRPKSATPDIVKEEPTVAYRSASAEASLSTTLAKKGRGRPRKNQTLPNN